MSTEVNQGVVGDIAKLMMHRLIARQTRRDPTLVERAKIVHARQADQFASWPFVREWDELLRESGGGGSPPSGGTFQDSDDGFDTILLSFNIIFIFC
jgi:hypothetical protein